MLAGLACLALAVILTVALIAKVVFGTLATVLLAIGATAVFGYLWFVAPLLLN